MRRTWFLAILVALALVATGCTSSDNTTATTTTSLASSTSTSTATSTSTTEQSFEVEYVTDLTWTTPNIEPELVGTDVQWTTGQEWPLSVAHPPDGPPSSWPIVVIFHGTERGTPFDGIDEIVGDGAVVVSIRWTLPEWSVINLNLLSAAEYVDGYWFDVGACAYAAAQEVAESYGGNPDWTTVVGFSAGVHPAGWTGLGVTRNDLCPERDAVQPRAMVTGDAQWLFQGEDWDETFLAPNSLAADTVDRYINPERWNVPPEFRAYLWLTESTAWQRPVENPPAADSWLRARTVPPGTTVEDLDSVGGFDDGLISFVDNGLLLHKRMQDAGITVTYENYPTNHAYAPGVYERIAQIIHFEDFS